MDEKDIKVGENPMTSKEEWANILLRKAQEKDDDAVPYVPNADPAKIEEISKQLKKEYTERTGKKYY